MEHIANSQRIVVRQKKEMVEILLNWESNNRYEIYNENGLIFYALEDTDCCTRYWCQQARAYNIKFVQGNNCFLEMQADCFFCTQSTEISSPPGTKFGTINRPFAFCRPTFKLKDASGADRFFIPTPWGAACCKCCADVEIPVIDKSGEEVATITKQWGGFFKETFTDADTFGVEYKVQLQPTDKLLILASVFPVDMAFFERGHHNNNH